MQQRAAGRLVQTADQIQQRGLAGAGRAHDGDPLAALALEADAIDRVHGGRRRCRSLRDVDQFDEGTHRLTRLSG